MKLSMIICPLCLQEASAIQVEEDDFLDFCYECSKVIEGNAEPRNE